MTRHALCPRPSALSTNFIGKLMSSANFPAGCFGKLPSYGDFIRHNAASREALDFDQWIQQGLH
ncbi:MAG: TagF domain-containing protein, partial [bacterium]